MSRTEKDAECERFSGAQGHPWGKAERLAVREGCDNKWTGKEGHQVTGAAHSRGDREMSGEQESWVRRDEWGDSGVTTH